MHESHDDQNGPEALEASDEQLDALRELGVSEPDLVGLSMAAAEAWIDALRAEHGTLERIERE